MAQLSSFWVGDLTVSTLGKIPHEDLFCNFLKGVCDVDIFLCGGFEGQADLIVLHEGLNMLLLHLSSLLCQLIL